MSEYQVKYEHRFVENLKHYASLKSRIKKKVERIIDNPYFNTEPLIDLSGKLNLKGCRSSRIDRNFGIIFIICEECRYIEKVEYCFCEGLSDKTIVFLTVGTHEAAYAME